MAQRFEGKVVLVTGGNSGIGFATAKRIVQEGGRVIITGRDEKTLKQAQAELGPNAEAIRSDVSKLADLDSLYASIKQKYGALDGLFANAGIATFAPIDQVTEETYDRIFNVNVKGVFFTMQKAVPLLKRNASVVITASVVASKGLPATSVYSATKAAVRNLARSFSAEFVSRGIRFNVISPGPIETPIWDRLGGPKADTDAQAHAIVESNPMKRFGTPEEVANAASFLLSSESSYMTGAEILVDGGVVEL